jgi:predicted Zn-dependent protease
MDRIAALTKILAQNPADAFARYGLAMACAEAGQPEEALAQFAQLRAGSPDYVPAYQMAGQLLLRLNRTGEALDWLNAGLAAAGRTGNAHARSEMQALVDDIPTA